jgi:RecB family exonuclease
MHDIAARCLTTGVPAVSFVGQDIPVKDGQAVEFTDEMADLTQGYVDTVRAMATGKTLMVENRVDFSWAIDTPDSFGTADVIIWDAENGELIVMDLKTGHTPVNVERNSQLMLYALGALKKLVEEQAHAEVEEDSLV